MKTETLSWVPTAPVRAAGLVGQEAAPDWTTHTTPTALPVTVTETVTEWAIDPLTPVTVTVKVPEVLPVTVNVAVPDPVIRVGVMVAVTCVGNVTVRETTDENPLIGATVIEDVPEVLGEITMLVGLADNEKSGGDVPVTVRAMDAVWDIVPLVPVANTV